MALYKISDESPAGCDAYLGEGTSELFPMKFCSTRWIEDQPVAAQVLEVWSFIASTAKHWLHLSKSKRPKNNKSFDALVEHRQDLLIPANFHFFPFTAEY